MRISFLVAAAKNGVIGKDDGLPWHLPKDLRRVKELTMGKPILMGRKTFETVGKPLPGRTNIILTRDRDYRVEGTVIVHDFDQALEIAEGHPELMVLGGGVVYRELLDQADRIYLTRIDAEYEGDTVFPELQDEDWVEVEKETFEPDERHAVPFVFLTLDRRKGS